METNALLVYTFIALCNLLVSIVQGITGFGDGICLQVLWAAAASFAPEIFHSTTLGSDDVRIITVTSYVRVPFMHIVLTSMLFRGEWLRRKKLGAAAAAALGGPTFNLQFMLALAVPTTIGAWIGVEIFPYVDEYVLRMLLGLSSVLFGFVYLVVHIAKYVNNKRRKDAEATAKAAAAAAIPGGSFVATVPSLRNSFVPATTLPQRHKCFDVNGNLRKPPLVAAACASLLMGLFGSCTGVGAPPVTIFLLIWNIPQGLFVINFSCANIAPAVLRFFMGLYKGLFPFSLIPLYVAMILCGWIGLFIGLRVGKLAGPAGFSMTVLMSLLVCSFAMLVRRPVILLIILTLAVSTVAYVIYGEQKRRKAAAAAAAAKTTAAAKATASTKAATATHKVTSLDATMTINTSEAVDAVVEPDTPTSMNLPELQLLPQSAGEVMANILFTGSWVDPEVDMEFEAISSEEVRMYEEEIPI